MPVIKMPLGLGIAQSRLRELSEGVERNWDYVPRMVEKNDVSLDEAVDSVIGCLRIVIPEYGRMAKVGDVKYWKERLEEAEQALQAASDARTKGMGYGEIRYRGITLLVFV